jgi:periplasmic protein TonB
VITGLIYRDDLIVDCAQPLSMMGPEFDVSILDFFPLTQNPEETATHAAECCMEAADVELDCLAGDVCSDDWTRSLAQSNFSYSPNLTGEWELDLLPAEGAFGASHGMTHRVSAIASRSARPPALCASALVHFSFVFLLAFVPAAHVGGAGGSEGKVMMVTVVPREDVIPQDESPAAVDSVASMPSIAKKSEKTHEQPPPENSPDMQTGPEPGKVVMTEKPERMEEKQKKREEENPIANGMQNSVASAASTASAERQFIPEVGPGKKAFETMVLSAIRESIYFPKRAVDDRHRGEVVVTFVIRKDGGLMDVRITKHSGSQFLDEAALKIIQKAAKKFPPFPESVSVETLKYVVPIHFKDKRS